MMIENEHMNSFLVLVSVVHLIQKRGVYLNLKTLFENMNSFLVSVPVVHLGGISESENFM